MRFGKKIVKRLTDLRNKLRRAIKFEGEQDSEIDEVERLLRASRDAPVRLREHGILEAKFKIIIKKRKVAASIDEMCTRNIDQVDDDFVTVCIDAKELGFTGPKVDTILELYERFEERRRELEKVRRAVEQPQVDVSVLQVALSEARALKSKFGEKYCTAEEEAAIEALRLVEVEEAALNYLVQVFFLNYYYCI